ncbi:sigma-70 family RNA polymerase sigma factor [Curtobacterium sp. MCSS17_016]|uniref:sigma-70 family RNA polymerase sigma factor n=1 Tax=Curtobacterium sp. MCSS17_016 TaxID=2175644 RepID=UPI000DA9E6D3|nr:sigma-70 family RNA polymerase sigma factor [Curtobacterium sp. MCSS17_016]WIE80922.1 sigma-70 family RNA polymerase sigma factor [Curtobacterium sp. MCSS17_016]
MNTIDRDQLVIDHLPLVGYIVSDLCRKATHLDRSDLASAGQYALVKASRSYEPDRGVPFDAYARIRINGALSDELRSQDWTTRGTRKKITAYERVWEQLQADLGRVPSNDEAATVLGVSSDEVAAIRAANTGAPINLTADDSSGYLLVSTMATPDESAETGERDAFLRSAVANLPDRLRLIVERLYFEDKRVQDVADELGITHVSVSQARNEAVRLLRDGWTLHFDNESGHDVTPVKAKTIRGRYLSKLGEYTSTGPNLAAAAI